MSSDPHDEVERENNNNSDQEDHDEETTHTRGSTRRRDNAREDSNHKIRGKRRRRKGITQKVGSVIKRGKKAVHSVTSNDGKRSDFIFIDIDDYDEVAAEQLFEIMFQKSASGFKRFANTRKLTLPKPTVMARTYFHMAAEHHKGLPFIRYLCKALDDDTAQSSQKNRNQHAYRSKAFLLQQDRSSLSPFHLMLLNQDYKSLQYLKEIFKLQFQTHFESFKGPDGLLPIHCVALNNHFSQVNTLLKGYKEGIYQYKTDGNDTAIHLLAMRHPGALDALSCEQLEEVEDGYNGRSIWHYVIRNPRFDKVKEMVLSKGTIGEKLISSKDDNQQTPLQFCKANYLVMQAAFLERLEALDWYVEYTEEELLGPNSSLIKEKENQPFHGIVIERVGGKKRGDETVGKKKKKGGWKNKLGKMQTNVLKRFRKGKKKDDSQTADDTPEE